MISSMSGVVIVLEMKMDDVELKRGCDEIFLSSGRGMESKLPSGSLAELPVGPGESTSIEPEPSIISGRDDMSDMAHQTHRETRASRRAGEPLGTGRRLC